MPALMTLPLMIVAARLLLLRRRNRNNKEEKELAVVVVFWHRLVQARMCQPCLWTRLFISTQMKIILMPGHWSYACFSYASQRASTRFCSAVAASPADTVRAFCAERQNSRITGATVASVCACGAVYPRARCGVAGVACGVPSFPSIGATTVCTLACGAVCHFALCFVASAAFDAARRYVSREHYCL